MVTSPVDLAQRLADAAQAAPERMAIVAPAGRHRDGRVRYRTVTFAELHQQTDRIARGLIQRGLRPGMKLVLFVPFSIEFITLTFGLLKTAATIVLIDPGMGRRNMFQCLKEVEPDGFVAVPFVHLVRWFSGPTFRQARFNVSVGRWWPGVVATYQELLRTADAPAAPVTTSADDPAAIIFTSGSTGPPKGVLYEHGMFAAQVDLIREFYGIQPGEIDLSGFPLFGLFNAAMGVTTVIPDMDPVRPAQVDPERILEAIRDHQVTQAFGSPAFWNRIGRYCVERGISLPSIKRAFSAGGPVPIHLLERMTRVLTKAGSDLYTPYGATESLPVASIGAREILSKTADRTRQGAGTCVGRSFPGIDIKIIEITDGPITNLSNVRELRLGEIGEIIVGGPSVTKSYFNRPEATELSKIADGNRSWHRIGDVGYLDDQGRLWFCGRKAHVVECDQARMFSVCCEAIFNEHPRIYRTALVGVGTKPCQRPVIVAEPERGQFPTTPNDEQRLRDELLALGRKHAVTSAIADVLFHPSLPVDTRHNVKIDRQALAAWAASRLIAS